MIKNMSNLKQAINLKILQKETFLQFSKIKESANKSLKFLELITNTKSKEMFMKRNLKNSSNQLKEGNEKTNYVDKNLKINLI